jgi:hypothetical protein
MKSDEVHRAIAERGQNAFEFPMLERRSADACELTTEQRQWQEDGGHPDGAVVFDKTIGRLVGHIGAEVFVEAARDRPARDGSRE